MKDSTAESSTADLRDLRPFVGTMLRCGTMRVLMALLTVAILGAAPVIAADPLAEARRSYNLGEYDTARKYASEALKVPSTVESARLVLGRAHLELYRRSADGEDLTAAREALRAVNAELLDRRERVELTVGIGECLFLEDKFGTAAEVFEPALDSSTILGPAAHERVLDWWATSLDRLALSRARDAREPLYTRIIARMEKELIEDPSSAPAAYWVAAARRGTGNLDRALAAAQAGWITATHGRDRGAALRADLDRLVIQGIIPEQAIKLQPRDPKPLIAGMVAEWEALKAAWTK